MDHEATTEDRELLRDRVKGLIEQAGKSQKQVETDLGWGSGTLSRVFGGKKAVNAELLTALAGAVGSDPQALVEGTSWATLFGAPAVAAGVPAGSIDPEAPTVAPVAAGVPAGSIDPEAPTVKALPVAAEAPPAPSAAPTPAPSPPVSDASSTTVRSIPTAPASAISAPPTPVAAVAAMAAMAAAAPPPAPSPVAAVAASTIPAPTESSRAKLSNPPAAPPPGPPAATPPPAPSAGEAEAPGMMGRIRQFFSRMWSG